MNIVFLEVNLKSPLNVKIYLDMCALRKNINNSFAFLFPTFSSKRILFTIFEEWVME